MITNPIFCAIDTNDVPAARALINKIAPYVGGIKLGMEFFMANGPAGIKAVRPLGLPLFLDLKLHDIPNTVAGAIRSLVPLQATYITIHASGGTDMMVAAKQAAISEAEKLNVTPPQLLGVTALTSMDDHDLASVGQAVPSHLQVQRLAGLAHIAGLAGVICSTNDLPHLRQKNFPDFLLVSPGIRPEGSAAQDQKRIATPLSAIKAGASHIVIGRPITEADDPAEAARRIYENLKSQSA